MPMGSKFEQDRAVIKEKQSPLKLQIEVGCEGKERKEGSEKKCIGC